MTDVGLMIAAFLGALLLIGTGLICYYSGKSVQRQTDVELRAAAEEDLRQAMLHRANRLRDFGRVTDAHPGASGPPAVVRNMRVLGMRPDGVDKPPTRM